MFACGQRAHHWQTSSSVAGRFWYPFQAINGPLPASPSVKPSGRGIPGAWSGMTENPNWRSISASVKRSRGGPSPSAAPTVAEGPPPSVSGVACPPLLRPREFEDEGSGDPCVVRGTLVCDPAAIGATATGTDTATPASAATMGATLRFRRAIHVSSFAVVWLHDARMAKANVM